jgi:hypothetical protein
VKNFKSELSETELKRKWIFGFHEKRKYWYPKHFRENVGIPNIFAQMLTTIFLFVTIFAKIWNYCKYIHFPNVVVPWLSCPGYLSGWLVQSDLSLLSCPSCLVPDVCPRCTVLTSLPCPGCPVPAVLLFQLPCPGHLVHCSPDTTCNFLAVLSSLSFPGWPFVPTCRDCHVPTVLYQLSCPGLPVLDVLSEWFCPRCPL